MSSINETFNAKLSIFIPRVDTRSLPKCKEDETDQDYETRVKSFIAEQFHNYNIGDVERVDLVTKLTPEGYPFYIAFIHFTEWYNNFQAKGLQKAVFNPDQKAKMYVNPRSYWIICENKKPLTEAEVEMNAIVYEQEQELETLKKEVKLLKEKVPETNKYACYISPEAKRAKCFVDMKAIISKQEEELKTLKKEVESLKNYGQSSIWARWYARNMQEELEAAATQVFETPVQTPVQFDRPPQLKRSIAIVLPDLGDEPPSPPMLTRCITERVDCPTTLRWEDDEEEEEMPPPALLTRCNTEKMGEDGEEEDIHAGPAGAQEDIPPPPTLTRCNA